MCLRETQWEHTVQRGTPDVSKSCSCLLKAWIHNDGLCPGTGWASTDLNTESRHAGWTTRCVSGLLCLIRRNFRTAWRHLGSFQKGATGHLTPSCFYPAFLSAAIFSRVKFKHLILSCISTLQQLLFSLHVNSLHPLCSNVELYKWAPSQASFQSVCRKMHLLF